MSASPKETTAVDMGSSATEHEASPSTSKEESKGKDAAVAEDATAEDATPDKNKDDATATADNEGTAKTGDTNADGKAAKEDSNDAGKSEIEEQSDDESGDEKRSKHSSERGKRKRSDDEIGRGGDAGAKQQKKPAPAVDREKTCPLLLRVFVGKRGHHRTEEFQRGRLPEDELQMYTWLDATLKELSGLIMEVHEGARKKGTKFAFATVFSDKAGRGNINFRDVGSLVVGVQGPQDDVQLRGSKFQIGDYLDIAIYPPPRGDSDRRA